MWTHHHQYDKLGKLIRPFSIEDEDGNFITKSPSEVHDWTKSGWKSGDDYFYQSSDNEGWDKSVLDKTNGILNIVPKYTNGGCTNIHTKDCMFSIENLASPPKKNTYARIIPKRIMHILESMLTPLRPFMTEHV